MITQIGGSVARKLKGEMQTAFTDENIDYTVGLQVVDPFQGYVYENEEYFPEPQTVPFETQFFPDELAAGKWKKQKKWATKRDVKDVTDSVNNLHTKREAIEWRAGLKVTDPLQLYVYNGVEYLPKASEVPFITGDMFYSGSFIPTSLLTAKTPFLSKGSTTARSLEDRSSDVVNVKDFGAVGDGVTDDTVAIQTALGVVQTGTLYFPKGTYHYTGLDNIIRNNFTIKGDGSGVTILNYTGNDAALRIDAFASGSPNDPFITNFNLKGFSITGTKYRIGIIAQGISRSQWEDLRVNGSDGSVDSVAYELHGVQLCRFSSLFSSYTDGRVPYRGIILKAGTRAGISIGACSGNAFTHIYPEQNEIGLHLTANGADQNTFSTFAPEGCKQYGMIVGDNCRYNTFIGGGFENLHATKADVADSGIYSTYIGCYSSNKFLVQSAAKGCKIMNGYYEFIDIINGAKGTTVENVTVNSWDTNQQGFRNGGTGTRIRNIWDADKNEYTYEPKARYAVVVDAYPFTWINDNLQPVKVKLYDGVITQVLIYNDKKNDFWEEPKPVVNGGIGVYLLQPGESIRISHSTKPIMNVIPQAGY